MTVTETDTTMNDAWERDAQLFRESLAESVREDVVEDQSVFTVKRLCSEVVDDAGADVETFAGMVVTLGEGKGWWNQ